MSSDIDATQPPAAAPAAPPLNTLQRITGAIVSPDSTFADIARKPNWIAPLIIWLVIGYASGLAILPKVEIESSMREQMEASQPNMPEADMDRTVKFMTAMTKGAFYVAPVISVITFLVIAFVYWLAFKIFKGAGTYEQAFSTTLYAWTPMMIKSILTVIVVFARGSVDLVDLETVLRSSPAFLVDRKTDAVLFALLSSLDAFTIWMLVLFTIGFAHVSKFTKAKAGAIVAALWAIVVLFKVGGAAISAAAAKKARAS